MVQVLENGIASGGRAPVMARDEEIGRLRAKAWFSTARSHLQCNEGQML